MDSLSILLNVILQMHFNESYCIMHLHSQDGENQNHDNLTISLWGFPVYLVNTINMNDWGLDEEKYCRDFLITSIDSAQALEHFEYVVKVTGKRGYSGRRYIIVLQAGDAKFWQFFNSTALHYVRDILVIKPMLEQELNEDIYYLYTHKYVGIDNYQMPILLDIWHSINASFQHVCGWNNVLIPNDCSLFPDKVSNLFGRAIDSPFIELPPYTYSELALGSEYKLFLYFLIKYNMSFKDSFNLSQIDMDASIMGMSFFNWTGYGIRGALVADNPEESVDMTFGGNIGGEMAEMLSDMVTIVHYGVSVIVPIPKEQHEWISFLKTFKTPLWILYITAYTCLFLLVRIHSKYDQQCQRVNKLSLIAYFGLVFNQPLINTNYRTSMRYLLAITLILSLLFLTMFSSRLLSTLIVPYYTDNVETVKDLAKSDLIIVSTVNYFELIYNDERPLYKKLYQQVFYTFDYNLTAKLFTEEKYSFGIIKHDTGFITSYCVDLFLQENVNQYQILKDDVVKWNTYMVLRKNSVISPQLELVVERTREAGLLRFWEFEIFLYYNVTLILMKLKDVNAFDPGVFKLQWMHIKGAFGILFFGFVIGFLIFLIEMFPFIRHTFRKLMRQCKRQFRH